MEVLGIKEYQRQNFEAEKRAKEKSQYCCNYQKIENEPSNFQANDTDQIKIIDFFSIIKIEINQSNLL